MKKQHMVIFILTTAVLLFLAACGGAEVPVENVEEPAAQPDAGSALQNVDPTPEFDTIEVDPDAPIDLSEESGRGPACAGLEGPLNGIVNGAQPMQIAEQLGARIEGDTIQVIVTLAGEETGFLQELGLEAGTQNGNQVQLFVPIDQLCELASAAEVTAVSLPMQAAPQ